jgi:excisionase family DNA binding protein
MSVRSPLAQAFLEALDTDPAAITELVDLLAPHLSGRVQAAASVSPWLDAAGAAEHMATTTGRIYDLVQLGKLSPQRDGRRLLFRRDDLERYLADA